MFSPWNMSFWLLRRYRIFTPLALTSNDPVIIHTQDLPRGYFVNEITQFSFSIFIDRPWFHILEYFLYWLLPVEVFHLIARGISEIFWFSNHPPLHSKLVVEVISVFRSTPLFNVLMFDSLLVAIPVLVFFLPYVGVPLQEIVVFLEDYSLGCSVSGRRNISMWDLCNGFRDHHFLGYLEPCAPLLRHASFALPLYEAAGVQILEDVALKSSDLVISASPLLFVHTLRLVSPLLGFL